MRWPAIALLVALAACDGPTPSPMPDASVDAGVACGPDTPPTCEGDRLVRCVPDGGTLARDCTLEGLRCAGALGCTSCAPGAIECRDGTHPLVCRADGSGFDEMEACDAVAGRACSEGRGCIEESELCGAAADDRSYLGCEYWPTVTLNNLLGIVDASVEPDVEEFRFAVAVANPQPMSAEIEVTRAGEVVATATVAPESTETIELPWIEALRAPRAAGSAFVRDGAYRLRSTVPVSAFQFNALQYRVDSEPPRFSYSNDASLLFPARAVQCDARAPCRFVALSTAPLASSPSFVSVTATGGTVANVTVRASVPLRASTEDDGETRVPLLGANESATFALEPGDVLSLAAVAGDVTGTIVTSDAPVAVIAGNGCANVPGNTITACDHLEESMPPVSAWGTRYSIRRTRPAVSEPNQIRVVAAFDDTVVSYGSGREYDVLQAGDVAAFPLRDDTLSIIATRPILVAQLLVGQSYSELAGGAPAPYGDPSLSIVVPDVQHRRSYVFLTPATYDRNSVAIVSSEGARITLDGAEVPLASSGALGSADVSIEPGFHVIRGDRPFGIQVYSLADYTSYMYPGGLNLYDVTMLQ